MPTKQVLKDEIKGHCRHLTLELTEECNLRCGYCIYNEHHRDFWGFGFRKMTFDIAKQSLGEYKETSLKIGDWLTDSIIKQDSLYMSFSDLDLLSKSIEIVVARALFNDAIHENKLCE